MNKKPLIVVSISLLVSSCMSTGIIGAKNCVVYEPVDTCTGDKNDPKVTLNLNTMKANPPNVCGAPGETIVVSLVPPPENIGSVAVVPKNFTDTWLLGTNSPDKKKINIVIPAWVPLETNHEYGFVTKAGKCADPRLRVR